MKKIVLILSLLTIIVSLNLNAKNESSSNEEALAFAASVSCVPRQNSTCSFIRDHQDSQGNIDEGIVTLYNYGFAGN